MFTPQEVLEMAGKNAIKKSKYSAKKTLILAFSAGAFIAVGGLLSIIIGGGMPGIAAENPGIAKFFFGAAFPVGLILVALLGTELFTGNTSYFIPKVMNKELPLSAMLKNWGLVYVGNFFGAIFVAYFLAVETHIVSEAPFSNSVLSIAMGKTSHTFWLTFWKGVGANWLVCLAMWAALAARYTSGKIIGIWFPVMTFVAMGFEHSIANMFFIPLAIFQGADITWGHFITANLIPATLGNIVGGAFFVGMLNYWAFGKDK